MLLPGPEAQQLATYVGWLLHRTAGGLVAGILFVLPGAIVMLALSTLYAGYRELTIVEAVFFGIRAAVLAVVIEAVLRIGRRALKSRFMVALAAAAFVAIFFLAVPFPGNRGGGRADRLDRRTISSGHLCGRRQPKGHGDQGRCRPGGGRRARRGRLAHTRPSAARAAKVALICLVLWLGPITVLAAWLGLATSMSCKVCSSARWPW